jgi:hypothetical protein
MRVRVEEEKERRLKRRKKKTIEENARNIN